MTIRRVLLVVLVAGLATAGWLCYRWIRSRPDYSMNVVLVVVDALRADHLSTYGYKVQTSPNIDNFAREGSLFEHAFCPVPSTQPSFSTLLTSLHAYSHGVQRHGVALSNKAVTLTEILRAKGWDTAAVVGASNLDAIFGFAQGFNFYEDSLGSKVNVNVTKLDNRTRWERKAGDVNQVVFDWLNRRDQRRPFFLMIHYFDTHHPYQAPPPYDAIYPPGDTEESAMRAAYDGEVRYVDIQFGRLLKKLDELKVRDHTLVILTADHGENLGEHHWRGHEQRIQDEAVHIPLILQGPRIPRGKRFIPLVQNVDLAPAILETCRVPIPEIFQGRSLLRVLRGETIRNFVFLQIAKRPDNLAELTADWQKFPERVWAVRTMDEKFIYSSDNNFEFYDLQKDPLELNNIYAQKKRRAAELEAMGKEFLKEYPSYALNGGPQKKATDNDPEEAMRALGYIN